MLRKRIAVFLVLAFLGVGLAVGLFLSSGGETEPSWEGRSLSEWLATVPITSGIPTSSPTFERAEAAVRRMGTNTFPFVLKWAAYEPPKWRRPLDALCDKYPALRSSGFMQSTFYKTDCWHDKAELACLLLRSNAAPILHDLARIAAATPNTEGGKHASTCLGGVLFWDYNDGGQLLHNALSDPDPFTRKEATNVLRRVSPPDPPD